MRTFLYGPWQGPFSIAPHPEIEARFEARFRLARQSGELRAGTDPAALAMLAAAVLHSLALRARAGTPRRELEDMARKMVNVICA